MRIQRIHYTNYRCFKNLKLDFSGTTPEKNIFMVVAPNGGGKTEMLFSFQWVLYGFDFKSLQSKENTPWSLNSTLYHNLQRSKSGDNKTASVELVFEERGKVYRVKRSEKFIKKHSGDGIWSETKVEFSETKPNGVSSLPITDPDEVLARLSRIIPLSILQGIIFDGERMKSLSQANDQSKKAVEGVFKQITNVTLFEHMSKDLRDLSKENSKAKKLLSTKNGDDNSAELQSKLTKEKDKLEKRQNELEVYRIDLAEKEKELEDVSKALSEIKEVSQFEEQRERYKRDLGDKEENYVKYLDYLYKDLDDGWLLLADTLFDDVEQLLQNYDIPAGLTVSAVRNILERDTCICGHKFDETSRKVLEDLIKQLPPDNMNSAIGEMVHQGRLAKVELKEKLNRSYKEIRNITKQISELKQNIADISTQITEGASEEAKKLEERNKQLTRNTAVLEKEIQDAEDEIATSTKLIVALKKRLLDSTSGDVRMKHLNKREEFLEKCISAVKEIESFNKIRALANINERINECYRSLSEDYENGRRLYIVQYDERKRYHLASYLQTKFDRLWEKENEITNMLAYKAVGVSEDEVREKCILNVLESNSTGQAKINTLAFAKAILDYSRFSRDEQEIEISHSFPFMIDSPFTELSDGNLMMSAKNIHLFSDQIILMISNESLDSVRDIVTPYVGQTVKLTKNSGDAFSTLILD